MKLALKIDVATHRGTREGVPRLIDMLARHGAQATFLFSLGPDHTGRAVKRVFRPGFMKKVARTSAARHYGFATLLYGTLLPGPDIGRIDAGIMRAARDAGHEVGIHAYDHVRWQDEAAHADGAWTRREMERARVRFQEIFGEPAIIHGAAGWQMNAHAFRLTQGLGFRYASDTRGTHPFIPVCRAEITACPQLPTTLPTLDELIGLDGIGAENVAARILDISAEPSACGHVYTAHAEFEGGRLAPVFDALLAGWRARGIEPVALRDYAADLDLARLPRHVVVHSAIPGRSGELACQGEEFLA